MKTMTLSEKQQFLDDVVNCPILVAFVRSYEVRAFIACQFALESAFGSSLIADKCNNYCGMKTPTIRFTLADDSSKFFASYDSFQSCLVDYIVWIIYNRPACFDLEQLESFKSFLRFKHYCPDEDYISLIEAIYNQFFNPNL